MVSGVSGTATHCNTLQQHCNNTATTLQCAATHYNTRTHLIHKGTMVSPGSGTATHCNILQHTATQSHIPNTPRHYGNSLSRGLQRAATHCKNTTTHCNILQHTATTLQHTATHYTTRTHLTHQGTMASPDSGTATHCNNTTTDCSRLQQTATHAHTYYTKT